MEYRHSADLILEMRRLREAAERLADALVTIAGQLQGWSGLTEERRAALRTYETSRDSGVS